MPLFAEQKLVLKSPSTKVKFEQDNPETPGSKTYQGYDKYKLSDTIGETTFFFCFAPARVKVKHYDYDPIGAWGK